MANCKGRRRKVKRQPPGYYIKLRKDLAGKGRTPAQPADNTKKFSNELRETPDDLLRMAKPEDFKAFLRWTLDKCPRKTASTMDVTNYKKILEKEYSLRKLPQHKPVMSSDDLYHLLFVYWVYDDSTYPDERQRVQVATALLLAAFTGCRLCSLFDTRLRFEDDNQSDEDKVLNRQAHHIKTNVGWTSSDDDLEMPSLESNSDVASESDFDKFNAEADNESEMISDAGTSYDSDGGTQDGYDAGPEETRSILYRHVSIIVARNPTPGEPNVLFAKIR
ncbi:MAG: hypothetical protein M1816_000718 [Peltula sp. TS41687]|nr:MAG: hypothetical protein M1816_000718 [Peltula sp. TS41687]